MTAPSRSSHSRKVHNLRFKFSNCISGLIRYHSATSRDLRPFHAVRPRSFRQRPEGTGVHLRLSPGFFCKTFRTGVPRFGETSYYRIMRLKEKLQILMARHSLNGQRLAKLSQVSDSEISRILQGKSRPGLDNAFRLAKAVNVSLDFLADDALEMDASQSGDMLSPDERKVLNLTQKIGGAEVVAILENVRFLGYEVAMSRLIGAKPIIEVDKEPTGELRPPPVLTAPPIAGPPRVTTA
jgi:transcriptional regulator with XRE-family HTH domain